MRRLPHTACPAAGANLEYACTIANGAASYTLRTSAPKPVGPAELTFTPGQTDAGECFAGIQQAARLSAIGWWWSSACQASSGRTARAGSWCASHPLRPALQTRRPSEACATTLRPSHGCEPWGKPGLWNARDSTFWLRMTVVTRLPHLHGPRLPCHTMQAVQCIWSNAAGASASVEGQPLTMPLCCVSHGGTCDAAAGSLPCCNQADTCANPIGTGFTCQCVRV